MILPIDFVKSRKMDKRDKETEELAELELKLDILEFALAHNLKIHPGKDLEGFCSRAISAGHCPCHKDELYCPCPGALEMCLKDGYCSCRLFITPELYPEALAKARKRWEKKKVATQQ